jgi:hypothetical protein
MMQKPAVDAAVAQSTVIKQLINVSFMQRTSVKLWQSKCVLVGHQSENVVFIYCTMLQVTEKKCSYVPKVSVTDFIFQIQI